ncbi:iron ABC transporter permease [Paenibacillus sp.]|uniref:FecCD family ABC transporter permease n=1 Tax=Paenibacillus sp. TaxID=58172 RepID=UPI002D2EC669|nr:iron ABC transporter permease [Paenibacillus sp.]HZG87500.1 iron ABC transporter permease [Paenibacillus sp.]
MAKRTLIWISGLVLLACATLTALLSGAADIGLRDVWAALAAPHEAGANAAILRDIRMPRVAAALVVGAALATAGAIMQGMTRNPLADPGLLGLTAGANAALAFAIAFLPQAGSFGLMLVCFAGAGVGSLLVFGVGALRRGGYSPVRIVLAGAAVSAFLYALADAVGLMFRISKNVSMWTAGGFIGATWDQLAVVGPAIAAGLAAAMLFSKQLTILSLSEEVAVGLGQRTAWVKAALSAVVVLLAGASVALAGSLAFAGLMVPHLARAVVGTDYRLVLPMSAIGGAALMAAADTAARTVHAPFETPVAAVVAILGVPFFFFIVRRGGRAFA